MKSAVIIFLCLVGVLCLCEYARARAHEGYQSCEQWSCGTDCFDKGLHGECDMYDTCQCYNCIYQACRKFCMRQNRIGQCDGNNCLCL